MWQLQGGESYNWSLRVREVWIGGDANPGGEFMIFDDVATRRQEIRV